MPALVFFAGDLAARALSRAVSTMPVSGVYELRRHILACGLVVMGWAAGSDAPFRSVSLAAGVALASGRVAFAERVGKIVVVLHALTSVPVGLNVFRIAVIYQSLGQYWVWPFAGGAALVTTVARFAPAGFGPAWLRDALTPAEYGIIFLCSVARITPTEYLVVERPRRKEQHETED